MLRFNYDPVLAFSCAVDDEGVRKSIDEMTCLNGVERNLHNATANEEPSENSSV